MSRAELRWCNPHTVAQISAGLLEALLARFIPHGMSLASARAEPSVAYNGGVANDAAYAAKMLALHQLHPDDEFVALLTVGALLQVRTRQQAHEAN